MPFDRSALDAQLREIGEGERWWEQREFRALPYILHADERILGLVNGKLLGARRPRIRPTGTWLLVVTDQRLICIKQDRFARRQLEFTAGQITSIRQNSRLRTHQIAIDTPQGTFRLRIPKEDAFRFTGALAQLLPNPPVQRIGSELEPWPWLPGAATVGTLPGVAGIVSRVAMLSAPAYATRDHVERMEAVIERLQGDVERLQQQVSFLEDLLQKQAEAAFLPRGSADS